MSRLRVLVAGASGALGRLMVKEALARGHQVVALGRDRARLIASLPAEVELQVVERWSSDALAPALAECDAVLSSLGASVSPSMGAGRAGYLAVDWPLNQALADAAASAGVRRFVYVSVAGHDDPEAAKLAYYRAHERVVAHLGSLPLERVIIRPTGFFSALTAFVDMAHQGKVPQIGDGSARSNPIADADLARICVDGLDGAPREATVGGPEAHTRREMIEQAFAAVGRPPRISTVPPGVLRVMAKLMWPISPRLSQLLPFVVHVSTHDVVAPMLGTLRLDDAFREHARAKGWAQ